jgi:4-carboxymuconolactone decarboxylase
MSQERVALLEPPYDPAVAAHFDAIMPPGVPPLRLFRAIGRSPRILEKLRGGNLLDRGPVSRRDRELVILRTCARCRAEYEWGVHVTFFAPRVGISDAQVRATVLGEASDPVWSKSEASLIRMVDELHDRASLSDATWADLSSNFTDEQRIELIALVGFYHSISFLTNGLRIDLEEWAARFPIASTSIETISNP